MYLGHKFGLRLLLSEITVPYFLILVWTLTEL